MAAHDREGAIRCEGREAVAVFYNGDVICARCGERVLALHLRDLPAGLRDGPAAMLGGVGNGVTPFPPATAPPTA